MPGEDKLHSTARAARRRPVLRRTLCAAGLAALALTACQKPAGQDGPEAAADPSSYLPPPLVMGAAREANGAVTLSGEAPGGAEVRLREPSGGAFSATADDDGDWSMRLPPSDTPRMFAFEADLSGRLIHGEGAVMTLPAPGPVAMLARAGYGALPIGQKPGALRIMAVDYDGAGGGSISGVATPRTPVRFVLDGQPVGAGQADDEGRFALLDLSVTGLDARARQLLSAGSHTVRVESPSGAVQDQLVVARAKDLGGEVFRAEREADAWRTDWRTPGGGVQTTLVFAATPTPPPAGAKP